MNAQTKLSLPSKGRQSSAADVDSPDEREAPAPATPRPPRASELTELEARDWTSGAGVVLYQQPRTRVYLSKGQAIIRQEAWPDEDVWLAFNLESVPVLIEALRAISDSQPG